MFENTPRNSVDQAAESAKKGIDATKDSANSASGAVSDKAESWRSSLSPVVGDAVETVVS